MSIVADKYRYVVGVDTHAKTHSYAIITGDGRVLDEQKFPTTTAGLSRALDWIGRRTEGEISATVFSVEGTGSYGAQLTATAAQHGYRVVEAPVAVRNGTGKTDALDARRAASAILPVEEEKLRDHRAHNGVRDVLQALVALRDQLQKFRTHTVNALTAFLRVHDLGIDARKALTLTQIRTIAGWRARAEDEATAMLREVAIDQAKTILALDLRLKSNLAQLEKLTLEHAPELRAMFGVGPVAAAKVVAAWSHPGRVHSEAAFAMIAGAAPIPASSGNTDRHRLNRGGDRQLNRALHNIVTTRLVHKHPETVAYHERRRAEGKKPTEIRRCLKRYLARTIYRTLNHATVDQT